jgi:uncharacterized repeat protein (TIGR03843 family)
VPEDERPPAAADLSPAEWLALLRRGALELVGRMPWSSNATFLVTVRGDRLGRAVYKPAGGERRLWDFPAGLYRREVAAYELSEALGLGVVPETVLRSDGPLGEGSLQRFVEADFEQHYFSLLEDARYHAALRRVAGFDLLANNADRKGGHLLVDRAGRVYAIDNGLCFHAQAKLRTVMWDFAGEPLPGELLAGCEALARRVPEAVARLLSPEESEALARRARALLELGTFPAPARGERPYPWPLV